MLENNHQRIHPCDYVRNFKWEELTPEEKDKYLYTYRVIGFGNHSDTGEKFVVYIALYGNQQIYCTPYDVFMSEVDKEKYPNIKQKYKFETINIYS